MTILPESIILMPRPITKRAVIEFGSKWKEISLKVGRNTRDCANHWFHVLQDRDIREKGMLQADSTFSCFIFAAVGRWKPEDEIKLKEIVMELTGGKGLEPYCKIPWTTVSERLDRRRSIQQCVFKWQVLQKRLKNNGIAPRWGALQYYHLVQQYVVSACHHLTVTHLFDRLKDLTVNDDTEIDWRKIAVQSAPWNLWSRYELAFYFRSLKRRIPGHNSLSHQGWRYLA